MFIGVESNRRRMRVGGSVLLLFSVLGFLNACALLYLFKKRNSLPGVVPSVLFSGSRTHVLIVVSDSRKDRGAKHAFIRKLTKSTREHAVKFLSESSSRLGEGQNIQPQDRILDLFKLNHVKKIENKIISEILPKYQILKLHINVINDDRNQNHI